MQIFLNVAETASAVVDMIYRNVRVEEGNSVHIMLTEDGATISILPTGVEPVFPDQEEGDEPSGSEAQSSGESGRKRPRRTKAQIEADNKAEADRLAATQAAGKSQDTPTSTTSAEVVTPNEPVQVEAAGDISQSEVQEPGETEVDPELAQHLASASAEEDAAADEALAVAPVEAEPETQVEAKAAEPVAETGEVKPISLFANLRRPNNG